MRELESFGRGYVELPLALLYVGQRFRVTGFDIDQRKVDALTCGRSALNARSLCPRAMRAFSRLSIWPRLYRTALLMASRRVRWRISLVAVPLGMLPKLIDG
jgi:hypothetical protein